MRFTMRINQFHERERYREKERGPETDDKKQEIIGKMEEKKGSYQTKKTSSFHNNYILSK